MAFLCVLFAIDFVRVLCHDILPPPEPRQNSPFHLIVFYSSECPICKKTARPLADIIQEYAPQGLNVTLVFPGSFEQKKKVERFCKEHRLSDNIKTSVVFDKSHEWVRKYHASITPEFFLISPQGDVLYSGALDDRFVKVGVQKPFAEKHYLKDALQAALNGREIPLKRTEPIGCYISK